MMRKSVIFTFLLAALLFSEMVSAIGIAPARVDVYYEPDSGYTKDYGYYVRGGDDADIRLTVSCRDAPFLEQYIIPSLDAFHVTPGEVRRFTVTLDMPEGIENPGSHQCDLNAEEVTLDDSGSAISAYSAVASRFSINVPYPDKYLIATLHAPNVALSETVEFRVSLVSRSLEDCFASGVIKVRDSSGKTVATLYTREVFIESGESGFLTSEWDTDGVPAGRYIAYAGINYGGTKPAEAKKEFKIGDIFLDITNITKPGRIETGDIVRLLMLIDSYWNEEMKDVYVSLEAFSEGNRVSSSNSENFDIGAWGQKQISMFWDTGELEEGDYQLMFRAFYANTTTEKTIQVSIDSPQDPYTLIIITLAAAMAAIAVLLFFRRKRR